MFDIVTQYICLRVIEPWIRCGQRNNNLFSKHVVFWLLCETQRDVRNIICIRFVFTYLIFDLVYEALLCMVASQLSSVNTYVLCQISHLVHAYNSNWLWWLEADLGSFWSDPLINYLAEIGSQPISGASSTRHVLVTTHRRRQ